MAKKEPKNQDDAQAPAWQWSEDGLNFRTRKWVRPEDLNANGSLFGGSLLKWIDEEAAIYAIVQLGNYRAVTKHISAIDFEASAVQGDLIEIGLQATHFGRTSLTMRAVARNMITRKRILTIEKIVFVSLDEDGVPTPHGYSEITYNRDRMPTERLATGTIRLPN
ncbi:putative acyl-CoA thioester hydrolase HI_0827 [Microbacterium oxydans]|uniref:Putative acyl-CoA thioester hydrolase n=1 Tax=Microbacterium oxydans TaxID=82380 RepID=A0A0F0LAN3_9MICO|nr:hotdog domain-containing protein [Microbacterium oxydans]KJL30257.1 putative acyl-CoA thioester hydrolase [Microbacterium oxydans]CAH0202694.1 putative acyl-CoA thioester hydrolase HI_0827 [Microbacterium oxydans]